MTTPFKRKKKTQKTTVVLTDEEKEAKFKEMQEFLFTMQKENEIVLKNAETKHVIFVGKSRNGKSTALETLKSPFTFVEMGSLYSETVEAKINHFTVEVEGESSSQNFNISIIDTPGLFEVKDIGTCRDNDELEAIVLKCMNAEITKIHAIFFVIAQGTAGINPQDIEALQRFINLFEGAQKNVHLLITKCENMNESDKNRLAAEIKGFPGFKELLTLISDTIFFLGAVEQADMDNYHADAFKDKLSNVVIMREEFFDGIFAMNEPFDLDALNISEDVRKKARKLFSDLKTKFAEIGSNNQVNFSMLKQSVAQLKSWANFMNFGERKDIKDLCDSMTAFITSIEYWTQLQDVAKSQDYDVTLFTEKVKNFKNDYIQFLDPKRQKEASAEVESWLSRH